MGVGLWLETLQPDRVFGIAGARQQYGHVFAELGAEAEVDEGVVKAGGLGEEAGEDAGEIGNVEPPRRPHRHHGVWRPCQNEGGADDDGNLRVATHMTITAHLQSTAGFWILVLL